MRDIRPKKGWWAPGWYLKKCRICGKEFTGDKRAGWCSDCAYRVIKKKGKKED